MSKAIHIIYKEDSKPEVILDGTFTVKEINIVPKFVNKAFEKYRRDRIIEAKKLEREEANQNLEKEGEESDARD